MMSEGKSLANPEGLIVSGMPRHVCIVADSNEGWARVVANRELHQRTIASFADVVDRIVERGGEFVTISMFSNIDWQAPRENLDRLMSAVGDFLEQLTQRARNRRYRIKRIGTLDRLPQRYGHIRKAIKAAETVAATEFRATLVVPFDYSGREEICRAFMRMNSAGIAPDRANEASIRNHLDDKDVPDPEIVVRLGGNGSSLSDIYTFQSEYAELFFLDHVPPQQLTASTIDEVLRTYAGGLYYSQGRPSEFAVAKAS